MAAERKLVAVIALRMRPFRVKKPCCESRSGWKKQSMNAKKAGSTKVRNPRSRMARQLKLNDDAIKRPYKAANTCTEDGWPYAILGIFSDRHKYNKAKNIN